MQVENELMQCKQEHLKWVHREEVLACQKSRIKWLAEGDSNTSFFHASMRMKKKNKLIERMTLEDGRTLESGAQVIEEAVSFFQEMLSASPTVMSSDEFDLVKPVISMEENEILSVVPSMNEVKNSLWSIPVDRSPGPDGFSASFFVLAWDIVKDDLLEMAKDFLWGNHFLRILGLQILF